MTSDRYILPIWIATLSIVFFCFGIHIQAGSTEGIIGRVFYLFCHVNIFHLAGNLIALHSISASAFRTDWKVFLTSYIISIAVPCSAPTEGMSGLLYAAMGILSWQALYKWKFHLWCIGFMALCFFFPQINAMIHVWCYALGIAIGYCSLVIDKWRKR